MNEIKEIKSFVITQMKIGQFASIVRQDLGGV